MNLWTIKLPLNFGSYSLLDQDLGFLKGFFNIAIFRNLAHISEK